MGERRKNGYGKAKLRCHGEKPKRQSRRRSPLLNPLSIATHLHVWAYTNGAAKPWPSRAGCLPDAKALKLQHNTRHISRKVSCPGCLFFLAVVDNGHDAKFRARLLVGHPQQSCHAHAHEGVTSKKFRAIAVHPERQEKIRTVSDTPAGVTS